MTDRILQEDLNFARQYTKRKLAATILSAMAETGVGPTEIDLRIGEQSGHTEKFIVDLMNCNTDSLNDMSDVLFAMGKVATFSFVGIHKRTPDDDVTGDEV